MTQLPGSDVRMCGARAFVRYMCGAERCMYEFHQGRFYRAEDISCKRKGHVSGELRGSGGQNCGGGDDDGGDSDGVDGGGGGPQMELNSKVWGDCQVR